MSSIFTREPEAEGLGGFDSVELSVRGRLDGPFEDASSGRTGAGRLATGIGAGTSSGIIPWAFNNSDSLISPRVHTFFKASPY